MARGSRPNIVWLLTDHHVFAHHYTRPGPRPVLPTYERLGREGVSFSRAYAVCPLCTPARASMLTGVYPHRHGMLMNNGDCGSRLDFDPGTRLFSHVLRDAGYRCGYFGKWHCGEERGPLDFAFEGWSMLGYGHPYWTDEYAAYLEEFGLPQATVDVEWHFGNRSHMGAGIPVLRSFALPDTDHHPVTVDVLGLKLQGLACAKARRVSGHQEGPMLGVGDAREEAFQFRLAEDLGQLLWGLPRRDGGSQLCAAERHPVEEANAGTGHVD